MDSPFCPFSRKMYIACNEERTTMATTIYRAKTKSHNNVALLIIVLMMVVYPMSYALGIATGIN